MLMNFGAVTFEVWPFNMTNYTRDTGADYAAKDVMGTRRPYEFMGEGEETMQIAIRLLPYKLGGMDALEQLHEIRQSGTSQILVRGDGTNLGWFMATKVVEKHSWLSAEGVGKIIDCDLDLVRGNKPSPKDYIATLLRLFL